MCYIMGAVIKYSRNSASCSQYMVSACSWICSFFCKDLNSIHGPIVLYFFGSCCIRKYKSCTKYESTFGKISLYVASIFYFCIFNPSNSKDSLGIFRFITYDFSIIVYVLCLGCYFSLVKRIYDHLEMLLIIVIKVDLYCLVMID